VCMCGEETGVHKVVSGAGRVNRRGASHVSVTYLAVLTPLGHRYGNGSVFVLAKRACFGP